MNEQLRQAVLHAGDLPTIPIVATKVMQLIKADRCHVEDIAEIVSTDPAIAARVLKIANSAFFGCQRQVQTIAGAIVVLGFNTLRSLVVAASVKEVYRPYGLTEKILWEHSLGAGLAARSIAMQSRLANPEEAFLAGLLHDIGKIVMNNIDAKKFQTVIQRCYNDHMTFECVEQAVFGFSHAELGALVVKKWNFPDGITSTILYHHSLLCNGHAEEYQCRLTAVTSLGNQFCHRLGIGVREPRADLDLPAGRAVEALGISPDAVAEYLAGFEAAYAKDATLLAT